MHQEINAILIIFTLTIRATSGEDYFCDKGENVNIASVLNGTIITQYPDVGYYDNNMDCSWTVTASAGSRIQFKVLGSNLQWAAENVICNGYDYVQIFDGVDKSSSQLISWCGEMNPGFVITTGHKAHITFRTNDRNIYVHTGVIISFSTFSDTECPQEWYTNTEDQLCYLIRSKADSFKNSQQYCTYSQSNLVSLKTDRQIQYVTELVVNHSASSSKVLWTGLNDILVNGDYRWLDGSKDQHKRKWRTANGNSYLECVTYDAVKRVWQEQFCSNEEVRSESKFTFICQMNKGSITQLYEVPDRDKDKGSSYEGPANSVWIAIGVGVASVILIVVVISSVCYVFYRRRRRPHKPKPRRRPTQQDAPPTYNEAVTSQF